MYLERRWKLSYKFADLEEKMSLNGGYIKFIEEEKADTLFFHSIEITILGPWRQKAIEK